MESNNNIQIHPTDCIDQQMLIKYAAGELSASEMYRVERHTSECPMCADELEGILLLDSPNSIHEITNSINSTIDTRLGRGRSISMGYAFRVAASFLVILSISIITYNYFSSMNTNYDLAENLYRKESVWAGKQIVDEKPFSGNVVSISTSAQGKLNGKSRIAATTKQLAYTSDLIESDRSEAEKMVADIVSREELLDEVVVIGSAAESTLAYETKTSSDSEVLEETIVATTLAAPSSAKHTQSDAASVTGFSTKKSKLKKSEENRQGVEPEMDVELDNEIYLIVQDMPQFIAKGYASFDEYIKKNIKLFTQKDRVKDEVVYIEFVVESNGRISNAKVKSTTNPNFNAEAIRVITSSPLWQPGMQRNIPVRVALTFPVTFPKN